MLSGYGVETKNMKNLYKDVASGTDEGDETDGDCVEVSFYEVPESEDDSLEEVVDEYGEEDLEDEDSEE